ncbi:MAG: MBL fold metallo-hydrolase [Pseudomonadota bacterium]
MSGVVRLTLLGTGSSGGVPRVGGNWGACDPSEPKNRRMRCSALVELVQSTAERPTRFLIDTSPDLRMQLLDAGTDALDAVVFTHDHADQTHGIDDLRPLAYHMRQRIPAYMDAETRASLLPKFRYVFEGQGGYPPILDLQAEISPGETFDVDGPSGSVPVQPIRLQHGSIACMGFRIGNIAYCNDVNAFPDESLERLSGLDVFVIDALRYTPHASHAHLEQTLEWAAELGAKRTILTNLHVDMDYQTLLAELPKGVEPGYDGFVVEAQMTDA